MAFELIKKWCSIGTKTPLPQNQDGVIPNRASYDEGFPDICSEDKNAGGLPPRREDINQILYLTSNNLTEIQSGNYPTFDANVSTFLSGYPEDAILWCASQKYFVRSTKASNTDNFVTTPSFLGTSWVRLVDTTARTPFCINSGNVDANGNGDLLTATGNILSFKVGGSYPSIIGTTADGVTFTFATLGTLDFGSDADGTYNVFIDNLGNLTKYKNTIYRQRKYPTAPVTNDIFLNTSIEVLQSYKYGGSTYTLTAETPVGQVVKTSGTISALTTFAFNVNGVGRKLVKSFQGTTDWYNIFWQYDYNSQTIRKFIEQGGEDVTPANNWSSEKAVTFLIPMFDTYYYANAATIDSLAVFSGSVATLLTTGMTVNTLSRASNSSAASTFRWEVKGYIS